MSNFTFVPVSVNHGRKFRGIAYDLGYAEDARRVAWNVTAYSVKLWNPIDKRYVYANPDFIEQREVDPIQLEADRKAYIDNTVNGTVDWCRKQKAGAPEAEVLQFARNVLRKHHPELMEYIDKVAPDQRDVVTEVERTFQWARNLRTRPCHIYGRYCPGGKPYSDARVVEIARSALDRKGITKLEGFAEAWDAVLTLNGLSKYVAA